MADDIRTTENADRRQQRHEGRTSQTYAAFLKDLMDRGGFDREKAERAAVSVLCLLEQRIQAGEAKDLNAQLPFKLQELLQRCPRHAKDSPRRFGADEFLQMISEDLDCSKQEAEGYARAVVSTVRSHVSEGEAEQVAANLPSDLRALWAREV
jgi:uncharacterized protein (DUF2267 family)